MRPDWIDILSNVFIFYTFIGKSNVFLSTRDGTRNFVIHVLRDRINGKPIKFDRNRAFELPRIVIQVICEYFFKRKGLDDMQIPFQFLPLKTIPRKKWIFSIFSFDQKKKGKTFSLFCDSEAAICRESRLVINKRGKMLRNKIGSASEYGGLWMSIHRFFFLFTHASRIAATFGAKVLWLG